MPKLSAIAGSTFLLVSMVTLVDACPAQGGVAWTQLNPANSPPARIYQAMAYDAARERSVLFGGLDSNFIVLSDTFEWDGMNWTRLNPAQSPSRREFHAIAYDAARQRVVLFGGYFWSSPGNNLVLSDTWVWDGVNWIRATPAQSPSARYGHAMAYDAARQRVVLFGGGLFDTWLWDGVNWAQASPAQSPSTTSGAMTYDAVRQRVVLFGGRDSGYLVSDTWLWDGVNWIRATPAQSPSAREFHAMAYDEARQRVVLFGGVDSSWNRLSDTWEWDGNNWTQETRAQSPAARHGHAMAYDAVQHRVVMFGGWGVVNYLVETWEFESLSPASFTTFGTGCPGSMGTPTLDAAPFSSPWAGDSFSIELSNLPPSAMTFMVTGLSNTFWAGALIPLPAPLMSWGMPGCTVYTDVVNSELLVNSAGTATWTKTIPNDANLIGLTFYNQAFVIDPGVNTLGATVSNAGEATIGMR